MNFFFFITWLNKWDRIELSSGYHVSNHDLSKFSIVRCFCTACMYIHTCTSSTTAVKSATHDSGAGRWRRCYRCGRGLASGAKRKIRRGSWLNWSTSQLPDWTAGTFLAAQPLPVLYFSVQAKTLPSLPTRIDYIHSLLWMSLWLISKTGNCFIELDHYNNYIHFSFTLRLPFILYTRNLIIEDFFLNKGKYLVAINCYQLSNVWRETDFTIFNRTQNYTKNYTKKFLDIRKFICTLIVTVSVNQKLIEKWWEKL